MTQGVLTIYPGNSPKGNCLTRYDRSMLFGVPARLVGLRRLWCCWISLFSLAVPLAAAPPVPSWHSVGPFGGGAEVIAVDPSNSSRIYTLTKNSFLYRSDDEGISWNLVRFPAQQAATAHALIINPIRPEQIWIGVSSANKSTQGIYLTNDAGLSWRHLEGLRGESVFSLTLFPGDPKIAAAGARDGVHLTRDGGENWKLISPPTNKELQPVMSLAFDPRTERTLYVGTPHLPWKTEDSGLTWRSIHHGMIDDSDILSLIINPKDPANLFIGACSGIYRTDNSATQWSKMLGITGAGYRTYAVAQDPSDNRVIYSGTKDGLWKSLDGGKSWHKTSPHIIKSIAISPADPKKIYLATQDQGVLRSIDGGETILSAIEGFADHRLSELATNGTSIYVSAAGQDRQIWRASLNSLAKTQKSWHAIALPPGLAGSRVSLVAEDTFLYATGAGGAYRTENSGETWVHLNTAPAPLSSLLLVGGKHLIGVGASSLYKSEDDGFSWKPIAIPSAGSPTIRRVFGAPSGSGILVETATEFWFSKDTGKTWEGVALPVRPSELYDAAIFSVKGHLACLVAGTSRGVFTSHDAGRSWQIASKGIDPGTVSTVTASSEGIFASQYGRIVRSVDHGDTWTELSSEGLDELTIVRLALMPVGKLIALTPSRGVFVLEDVRHADQIGEGTDSGSSQQPIQNINTKNQ